MCQWPAKVRTKTARTSVAFNWKVTKYDTKEHDEMKTCKKKKKKKRSDKKKLFDQKLRICSVAKTPCLVDPLTALNTATLFSNSQNLKVDDMKVIIFL